MKTSLAAIIAVLTLSLPLCAQQRGRTQVAPARTDLTSMLLELDRTTAATFTDISHTHIERWKGGWKSRGLSSYIMQRAAAADSGGFSGGNPAAFNVYSSDSSPTDMPRKIIIDNDDPPAKKPPVAKKKAAIQYTNQY